MLLLLLPSVLAPVLGFFFLVQEHEAPLDEVLSAPVSLAQAARALEQTGQGKVVRAFIGSRRPPWRYVLIVDRQGHPRRFWVDPHSGAIRDRGPGIFNDPISPDALPLADLLEAAERRAGGGRATQIEGTELDGRASVEIHVATPDRRSQEVYLDAYTAQVLVTLDRRS